MNGTMLAFAAAAMPSNPQVINAVQLQSPAQWPVNRSNRPTARSNRELPTLIPNYDAAAMITTFAKEYLGFEAERWRTLVAVFALCCSYYTIILAIYSFHKCGKCRMLPAITLCKMVVTPTQTTRSVSPLWPPYRSRSRRRFDAKGPRRHPHPNHIALICTELVEPAFVIPQHILASPADI